ncbi:PQQ-like domain-containing protein [Reichenbachiella faecimaris]|uniref:PQQ-like domain-containing protein n=1 Tax=Reichenbachiella faecimaris TaxID=692418 RepID=A0A1W2G898_REIFA|nr:PQQ-binding-like beta-propeller repeat protein [Reichenbachiella faecimaris]SMD32910.1 PQQ-like domain-containing protein [Reichenbachiella faecimaris]
MRHLHLLSIILLLSCGKAEEPIPLGKLNLDIELLTPENYYTHYNVLGAYQEGVEFDESNYISLLIKVNEAGSYALTTRENNGFKFVSQGVLEVGDTTIILQAVGTPISTGITSFEITTKHPDEIKEYNVNVIPKLSEEVMYATVQFEEDGDYSTIAQRASGETLWQMDGYSTYGAINNGNIYLSNSNALICANTLTGSLVWSREDLADLHSLSYNEGNVFALGKAGDCYALNANTGEIIWNYTSQDRLFPQSAPLSDNDLVFIEDSDTIRALGIHSGTTEWKVPFSDMTGTPVMQGDTLIVGSQGVVTSIDIKSGKIIWTTNKYCDSDLLLANNLVYYNSRYSDLRSIKISTGEQISSNFIDYGLMYAPSKWYDCIISYDGHWSTLAGSNSCTYKRFPHDYFIACPVVIHDDVIYAAGSNSLLYFVPYSGDLISRLSNDDTGLYYSEIVAIQSTVTGIVSYPTQSAMD